jgi:hypothetical protein
MRHRRCAGAHTSRRPRTHRWRTQSRSDGGAYLVSSSGLGIPFPSAELLGLTKMDWNNDALYDRLPVTTEYARKLARTATGARVQTGIDVARLLVGSPANGLHRSPPRSSSRTTRG